MMSSLILRRRARLASIFAALVLLGKGAAFAAPVEAAGGEANRTFRIWPRSSF